MNNQSYITQNMQQFSKINLLLEKDEDYEWYFQKEKGNIQDISFNTILNSKNKRYMIVAEPGYGKTRLLKEIVLRSKAKNKQAFFVDAKKIKKISIKDSLKQCKYLANLDISEEELQKKRRFKTAENDFVNNIDTIVCIDALDEVTVYNTPQKKTNQKMLKYKKHQKRGQNE